MHYVVLFSQTLFVNEDSNIIFDYIKILMKVINRKKISANNVSLSGFTATDVPVVLTVLKKKAD